MTTNENHTAAAVPAPSVAEAAGATETTATSGASSTAATERPNDHLRPRTGTIVWGVLVLAFCAFTSFQTVAPNRVDGTTFVIAAMIGIGLMLLAVGTAVVVRSARQPKRERGSYPPR